MTDVWRKMQGVDTHESVSDAEYLNMNIYITLHYDLVEHVQSFQCRYVISGDTIEWRSFDSPSEIFDWLEQKILDELETNQKVLNDKHTNK